MRVDDGNLSKFLGVRRFRYGRAEENDQVGQVTGLAWTEVGGELLTIEAAIVPGKGKLIHTGQLGEVMQESIQAAMTVVRSRAAILGLERRFSRQIGRAHSRAGRRNAEGRSVGGHWNVRGAGLCAHAHSGALERCDDGRDHVARRDIADRRIEGKVARRTQRGHRDSSHPGDNEKDLAEIPKNIKDKLNIVPVKWIDEVFELALQQMPRPTRTEVTVTPERDTADDESDTSEATLRALTAPRLVDTRKSGAV